MKQLVLLGLVASLALSACKKKDPQASLPAATQVGANTAGCLINGQAFVAADYGGGLLSNPIPALSYGFAFDSVYYLVMTGAYQGGRATVSLFIRTQKKGIYLLNQDTQYYPLGSPRVVANSAVFTTAGSAGEVYVTNAQHTGKVELSRADLSSGIGAGTFEFTAASQADPTKTVTITNGRFDRKQ